MSSYTIPNVIETTARGERVADVYSRLLGERIVFVGTPIDDGVANVVIAQLLHLASESPTKDVHLYINSPPHLSSTIGTVTLLDRAPDFELFKQRLREACRRGLS